jgi:hypothetical protein
VPASPAITARRPGRPRGGAPAGWTPTPALTAALARLLRSLAEREAAAGPRDKDNA